MMTDMNKSELNDELLEAVTGGTDEEEKKPITTPILRPKYLRGTDKK